MHLFSYNDQKKIKTNRMHLLLERLRANRVDVSSTGSIMLVPKTKRGGGGKEKTEVLKNYTFSFEC